MKTAHELPKSGKRPSVRLTDALVRGLELPAGKTDYTYFDADVPGFGVRCRASGSKHYVFVYQHGKRVPIGKVTGAQSVAAARKIAAGYYTEVRAGGDPAGAKAAAKEKAADTFIGLVHRYLQFQKEHLRPRSYENVRHYLEDHAKPLHKKSLSAITRRDVPACLSGLTFNSNHRGSGVGTKKQVRATVQGLFRWGMSQGLLDNNPAIGVTAYETKPRERALSVEELCVVWRALPSNDFGAILKLLMLTGQRAMEIGGLRRHEIRGDGIALPPERVKNGRAHFVPLAPAALAILDTRLQTQDPEREHVFGRRGTAAFANWGHRKQALDATITAQRGKPLEHWTVHDIRRSVVTALNEAGIAPPHVIEAIVNHRAGRGIELVYNKARYEPEKRAALNRWAEYLLATVEGRQLGSNVVTMRGA
jgi:integrase